MKKQVKVWVRGVMSLIVGSFLVFSVLGANLRSASTACLKIQLCSAGNRPAGTGL